MAWGDEDQGGSLWSEYAKYSSMPGWAQDRYRQSRGNSRERRQGESDAQWRERTGFKGDAWDIEHRGHQGGGYLPGSTMEMRKMLDFLRGKSGTTEGINAFNLSTEKGQEQRFLSRMSYMDYMTDPNIKKGREFFAQMLEGDMVGDAMKSANRDAIDRANAAQRATVGGSMGTGDVRMPGVEQMLSRKVEAAYTGQMGQANQQAALADINARAMAFNQIQQEKAIQQGLVRDMMAASQSSTQWNQRLPDKPNPWKAMGMKLLGAGVTAAGAAFGGPVGAMAGKAVSGALQGGGGEAGYYPENPGGGRRQAYYEDPLYGPGY